MPARMSFTLLQTRERGSGARDRAHEPLRHFWPFPATHLQPSGYRWYDNSQPSAVTFKDCWINWLIGTVRHEYCRAYTLNSNYSDRLHRARYNHYGLPLVSLSV